MLTHKYVKHALTSHNMSIMLCLKEQYVDHAMTMQQYVNNAISTQHYVNYTMVRHDMSIKQCQHLYFGNQSMSLSAHVIRKVPN